MGELIDLVQGGYKILNSDKIIRAAELIPFGNVKYYTRGKTNL
jgi:hypothetical protein